MGTSVFDLKTGESKGAYLNKRKIGADYEKRAADFLESRGYQVIRSNYRCRAGEIDVIAREGAYLVFVEVKYRRGGAAGSGEEAVDFRKQRRIIRSAQWYLMEQRVPADRPCRFDVVSFFGEEITLLKDAFQCESTF